MAGGWRGANVSHECVRTAFLRRCHLRGDLSDERDEPKQGLGLGASPARGHNASDPPLLKSNLGVKVLEWDFCFIFEVFQHHPSLSPFRGIFLYDPVSSFAGNAGEAPHTVSTNIST